MAAAGRKTNMTSSAIVDLEAAVGSDNSDYEMDYESGIADNKFSHEKLSTAGHRSARRNLTSADNNEDGAEAERSLKGQISKGVASYVWEESRQRANKAFSLYANIDILRPYYDVEPHEVRNRLVMSLVPRLQSGNGPEPSVPRELYGPTMLVFTLIAMLLFEMKSSGHVTREGTLMGTAFVTCFGYWLGVSCIIRLSTYICNTRIASIQILHLLGYALFGHCIVILLTTVFHPYHSHTFFYFVWLVFGGLSTLRLVSVLTSRTSGQSRKLALAGIIVTLHLLFLLYLHFAYHHVVEELSGVDGKDNLQPHLDHSPLVQDNHAEEIPVVPPPARLDIVDAVSTTTEAIVKFARKSLRRGFRGDVNMVAPSVADVLNKDMPVNDIPVFVNNKTFVGHQMAE